MAVSGLDVWVRLRHSLTPGFSLSVGRLCIETRLSLCWPLDSHTSRNGAGEFETLLTSRYSQLVLGLLLSRTRNSNFKHTRYAERSTLGGGRLGKYKLASILSASAPSSTTRNPFLSFDGVASALHLALSTLEANS